MSARLFGAVRPCFLTFGAMRLARLALRMFGSSGDQYEPQPFRTAPTMSAFPFRPLLPHRGATDHSKALPLLLHPTKSTQPTSPLRVRRNTTDHYRTATSACTTTSGICRDGTLRPNIVGVDAQSLRKANIPLRASTTTIDHYDKPSYYPYPTPKCRRSYHYGQPSERPTTPRPQAQASTHKTSRCNVHHYHKSLNATAITGTPQ